MGLPAGSQAWLGWRVLRCQGAGSGRARRGPGPDRSVRSDRHYYMLLVFVKVPILLVVVGAVLWRKEPQSVPEEQTEEPIYSNLSCDLTTDTAR